MKSMNRQREIAFFIFRLLFPCFHRIPYGIKFKTVTIRLQRRLI
jgi:hypothetical protein